MKIGFLTLKKVFLKFKNLISLFFFSKNWVVDPSKSFYYYWSSVVSLAVLYNYTMLIGRSAFLLLQQRLLIVWLIVDYLCDVCYIVDTIIQTRKGFLYL